MQRPPAPGATPAARHSRVRSRRDETPRAAPAQASAGSPCGRGDRGPLTPGPSPLNSDDSAATTSVGGRVCAAATPVECGDAPRSCARRAERRASRRIAATLLCPIRASSDLRATEMSSARRVRVSTMGRRRTPHLWTPAVTAPRTARARTPHPETEACFLSRASPTRPATDLIRLSVAWWYNWTTGRSGCDARSSCPMICRQEQKAANGHRAINKSWPRATVGPRLQRAQQDRAVEPVRGDGDRHVAAVPRTPRCASAALRRRASRRVRRGSRLHEPGDADTTASFRVDFIALHWYGWNAGSCDNKAAQLES